MALIRKFFSSPVTDLGPRTVRATCSTNAIDRAGEVVDQDGIDLTQFRENPIILAGHDPMHPIGLATSIGFVDGNLTAEIEFAPEGVSQKADEVCGLVKSGIITTVSIGFDPVETEPMNPANPRGPQRYKKITLFECSFVAIPANPQAVVIQKQLLDLMRKEGRVLSAANIAKVEAALAHHAEIKKHHVAISSHLHKLNAICADLLAQQETGKLWAPIGTKHARVTAPVHVPTTREARMAEVAEMAPPLPMTATRLGHDLGPAHYAAARRAELERGR